MSIYLHELKRSKLSLLIWSAVIAFMLAVSILLYPLMKQSMEQLNEAFMGMGDFSTALGVGELGIADFLGYFALECGDVLGLGGAIFAALTGIAALSREESDHTAEFLLSHPVKRTHIVFEKLLAVYTQILIFNIASLILTVACTAAIGEKPDYGKLMLVMLAYLLMHLEIASICFGLSAFMKGRGFGIGIGLALLLYFVFIISNITEKTEFLHWLTPFSYTNGSDIIKNGALELKYLAVGLAASAAAVICAFIKYSRKDIAG